MRHGKRTFKLGRTSSHRRCMMANMLKSLIEHGKIETSVAKSKELKRQADKMITLSKKNTLAAKRRAIAKLMITFNPLTSKETRAAKQGNTSAYNTDREVMRKLDELAAKYDGRNGGYTRIIRMGLRQGDGSPQCLVEYI